MFYFYLLVGLILRRNIFFCKKPEIIITLILKLVNDYFISNVQSILTITLSHDKHLK